MSCFNYSSFISYRHGQSDIKQRFIQEFHRALSGELELLRNEETFVDTERLKGGDFYNEALSRAMYESATLILIYQPNYFDLQYPYCAREYLAMRALEAERLATTAERGGQKSRFGNSRGASGSGNNSARAHLASSIRGL
jgi:hypothetical protein